MPEVVALAGETFDMPGAVHRDAWWTGRPGALTVLSILFLGLTAWWVRMADPDLPIATHTELCVLARNLASALFLTGGVLRMVSWRLTRDWVTARSALTLFVVGTALPSTAVLGIVVHDGPVIALEAPETRLVFVLPILVLAIAAARHSKHLMHVTVGVLFAVTLGVAGIVSLVTNTPAGERHPTLWVAAEALTAAVWAALATQSWARRRFAGHTTLGWVALALLLMAIGDLVMAWSLADATAVHGLADGCQLAAAVVACATASSGLGRSVRTETEHTNELTRALIDSQQLLARVEQVQRERLHDARSAVLGVIGATQLLSGPERMTTIDPAMLSSLLADELTRLQGLLGGEDAEQLVEFELADALGVVALARHLDGMVIDTEWQHVRVVGRPRATATVLDNLLRNAHRHAPGARVRVAASRVADDVEIIVKDDGPGIPPHERGLVLLPGTRGSAARGAGSGLGLSNAARVMAAQSGSLRIDGCAGGGTQIILRMPAAISKPTMVS